MVAEPRDGHRELLSLSLRANLLHMTMPLPSTNLHAQLAFTTEFFFLRRA